MQNMDGGTVAPSNSDDSNGDDNIAVLKEATADFVKSIEKISSRKYKVS